MAWTLYVVVFKNGKRYFGITSGKLPSRWKRHVSSVKNGSKTAFHNALRKYGVENVKIHALVVGGGEYIKNLEIKAIARFETTNRAYGYNTTLGGDTSPMKSSIVAAKVGAANRKLLENPEYLHAKLSILNSEESRAKNIASIRRAEVSAKKSAALTGYKHSDEARANMSAAQQRPEGRLRRSEAQAAIWTDEKRAAHGERLKGRAVPHDRREKISASLMGHHGYWKGKKRPPETGAKISASKMGHKVSDETKAKISAALRARAGKTS